MRVCLAKVSVRTLYIEPDSPWEHGYVEGFNGKLRDEVLMTLPPEPSPGGALDFGLDQEDQGHGQEASFGGRDREQAAAGGG